MVLITIVNGVYKPTYNWGAPSCTEDRLDIVERSASSASSADGKSSPPILWDIEEVAQDDLPQEK